jgi:hypothetical protein
LSSIVEYVIFLGRGLAMLIGVNLSSNSYHISFPVSDWECHHRGSASLFIEGRAFQNSFPYRVWEREELAFLAGQRFHVKLTPISNAKPSSLL